MATRLTEVDLQRIEARQQYDVPRADGAKTIYTPMGCPVDVALHCRTATGPNHRSKRVDLDIEGFTMDQSWYTFGVHVYTKYNRIAQTLTLFMDDGDGPKVVGKWER